jgi:hypothetical protein
MSLWLTIIKFGILVLVGVFLTLGFQDFRDQVLRPWWKSRRETRLERSRRRAARKRKHANSAEHREGLRWRAYYVAEEIEKFGEANDDAEMRLFGLLFREASSFINQRVASPRWRLDRLRDSVDFVAPYLIERWWRDKEFDRRVASVIYWEDVTRSPRARTLRKS